MIIGIDVNPVLNHHRTRGIGKTTLSLTDAVVNINSSADKYHLFFYETQGLGFKLPTSWQKLSVLPLTSPLDLPQKIRSLNLDILHINDYFFPIYRPENLLPEARRGTKLVVTVRDIIPLIFSQSNAVTLETNLFPILEHADLIIAISQHTKIDLVKNLGLPESKIKVIYHGVDLKRFRYLPNSRATAARQKHHLSQRFILYVSAYSPRKNHQLLIEAYNLFMDLTQTDYDLVLVSANEFPVEIHNSIQQSPYKHKIKCLHNIIDRELPRIYNAASIFAFTSDYEGFGNPLLEAMACGLPVVAVNNSSVPEVVGDAGLLVSKDPEEIAKALALLHTDQSLHNSLREKGLKRAQQFTWALSAVQTRRCFKSLFDGSAPDDF